MAAGVVYSKYIRSPAWRALRRQVVNRCGNTCERCHQWPVVNVHHLSYERLGSEDLKDLQGVCLKCHQEIHCGK